jgi:IS5 family transposase
MGVMTSGVTPKQADMWLGSAQVVEGRVAPDSIWVLLHREGHRLFPDEMFADLFSDRGRRSIPPQIVATVMVLQKCFGKTDREAVEAFEFDARWKYACGVDLDYPSFAHTVLVDMRARLARSKRPKRIFEVTLGAAHGAGLVGHRRVLDSTPLYDAVATMDTVTLVRSAIRALLRVADDELECELRSLLTSGDDYVSLSKPQIDWDDPAERDGLIDSRARDAYACLVALEGRDLTGEVADAMSMLATVVGQDLKQGDDGMYEIIRGVAADRVISTVDPEARHGHKTQARAFDGYKGHIAEDPDSEIITATKVTAGNVADGAVGEELIEDLTKNEPVPAAKKDRNNRSRKKKKRRKPKVFGDSAYGSGEFQQHLEDNGIDSGCKTQRPSPPSGGLFTKDRFEIDLDADTVTCPNGVTVEIRRPKPDGRGLAYFADNCSTCALRSQCTTAAAGRQITINKNEAALARARQRQATSAWRDAYRATRPKVERKLGHLMRHRHGGRRARVKGTDKVDADFSLLAAAINLARLATLGVHHTPTGWGM